MEIKVGVGIILNRFHAFWGLKPRCRLCQETIRYLSLRSHWTRGLDGECFPPEDTLVTSHQEGQLTLISEARTTLPMPPLRYTLQHLGVIEKPLSLQSFWMKWSLTFYFRYDHRKSERIETIGLQNRGRDECCLTPKPSLQSTEKCGILAPTHLPDLVANSPAQPLPHPGLWGPWWSENTDTHRTHQIWDYHFMKIPC